MRVCDILPGKYHISVTQDDIINGIRESGNSCPIALAVKRSLNIPEIDVESEWFHIGYCIERGPDEINNFILNFDNSRLVDAFEFDLELEYRERIED